MTVRGAEAMIGTPTQEVPIMARKAQLSLDHAADLWLGELARRGRAETTRRKYREILEPFCAMYEHLTPREITADHCRHYLNGWSNHSKSTLALYVTVIRRFFDFLYDEEIIPRNPAERIQRPRRPRPEDIDVVSVSAAEVRRMFDAVETWQELLCLSVLLYVGVRRRAASTVRRRDVDLDAGTIRFREKGDKVIVKPVPDELLAILRAADGQHVWGGPDAYLIPNRKPWLVRGGRERGHKVIYETVVKVAERAGVRSHVHALRAAFAVQFDEAHPDQVVALKELLGHARIETTMTYLRRKDKARAMEAVRDLSWRPSVFPANTVIPPAGFEPALPADPGGERDPIVVDGAGALEALLAQLHRHTQAAKRPRPRGLTSLSLSTVAVTAPAAGPAIRRKDPHPPPRDHRRDRRLRSAGADRQLRHVRTLLRALADPCPLALRVRMAGARPDRHARVGVGPVRCQPEPARLRLLRAELVRHPAGAAVPGRVAGPARRDVAGAGALADRLHRPPLRQSVAGARVPLEERLVLR